MQGHAFLDLNVDTAQMGAPRASGRLRNFPGGNTPVIPWRHHKITLTACLSGARTFREIPRKFAIKLREQLKIPDSHRRACWTLLSHFSGLSAGFLNKTFRGLSANGWQPRAPGVFTPGCRRRAACSKEVEPDVLSKPDSGEMLVKGQTIAIPPDTFKLNT